MAPALASLSSVTPAISQNPSFCLSQGPHKAEPEARVIHPKGKDHNRYKGALWDGASGWGMTVGHHLWVCGQASQLDAQRAGLLWKVLSSPQRAVCLLPFHPSLCGPGPPLKSPPSASMPALWGHWGSQGPPTPSLGKLSLELIKHMVLSPAHCPVGSEHWVDPPPACTLCFSPSCPTPNLGQGGGGCLAWMWAGTHPH